MEYVKERHELRRKEYKGSTTEEGARRRRVKHSIELRRAKREEHLAKRRVLPASDSRAMDGPAEARMLEQFGHMCASIMSAEFQSQLDAVVYFRRVLSFESRPPLDEVLAAGIAPRLVHLMADVRHPVLQFEAAWALTNLASGASVHTRGVMDANAVPGFMALLASPNLDVREQAVWGLANVAGDSPETRDVVLRHGAVAPLLRIVEDKENTRLSLVQSTLWALSNLCRGKPAPPFGSVSMMLPTMTRVLFTDDAMSVRDALWCISFLSDGSNDQVQSVLESGCVSRVVELLTNPRFASCRTPALRVLGNIVTGDDKQTQTAINAGCIPALLAVLGSDKVSLRKEACWALSNIAAGPPSQIQALVEHNAFHPVVDTLARDKFEIRKEAAWVIANAAAQANMAQISFIVERGAVGALVPMLSSTDAKAVTVALNAIQRILEAGRILMEADPHAEQNPFVLVLYKAEAMPILEQLQDHPNKDVYTLVDSILETYLDTEPAEEEEEMGGAAAMPAAAGMAAAAAAPPTFQHGLPPASFTGFPVR